MKPSTNAQFYLTVPNTICSSIQPVLLKMGIWMPETCRVVYDNKKNCCIKLVPLVIFIYINAKVNENHSSLDQTCPNLQAILLRYKQNTDY